MDANQKQTALRMIPYGLFVLTGETRDGRASAAAVNWVTQASFEPPLVAVCVKVDSGSHEVIKESGAFALNVLGKDQGEAAVEFFKSTEKEGDRIGGEPCRAGKTGAPIIETCPAYIECRLVDTLEKGDHSIFVGEVVEAGVREEPKGRPDDSTLMLRELGGDIFYGG